MCLFYPQFNKINIDNLDTYLIDDFNLIDINTISSPKYFLPLWNKYSNTIKFYKSNKLKSQINKIIKNNILDTTFKKIFNDILKFNWQSNIYISSDTIINILLGKKINYFSFYYSGPEHEIKQYCLDNNWNFKIKENNIIIEKDNLKLCTTFLYNILNSKHKYFTINEIFFDYKNSILIDRSGSGLNDILTKTIDIIPMKIENITSEIFIIYIYFRSINLSTNIGLLKLLYVSMLNNYKREDFLKCSNLIKKLNIETTENIIKLIYEDINKFKDNNYYMKLWYRDFITQINI